MLFRSVHEHDRNDVQASIRVLNQRIEELEQQMEAVKNTYQRMHRDVFEQQIMEDKDE